MSRWGNRRASSTHVDSHLLKEHSDVLRAQRYLDPHQLFNGERVGVLLRHHRDVVEAIKIWQRLHVRLVLDQLLGAAVEKADVWISLDDHLAIELQDEAQHAVRSGVLGAKVLPS